MSRIRNKNHFFVGVFLILVSCLAFFLSRKLATFSDIGLGSGFVPRMFAAFQLLTGFALIASGFLYQDEYEDIWHLRPLLVLAAIVFFCLSIERLGLALALAGLVLIACAANKETTLREAILLAVGTAAFSSILFVKLLGLSLFIWPPGLFS